MRAIEVGQQIHVWQRPNRSGRRLDGVVVKRCCCIADAETVVVRFADGTERHCTVPMESRARGGGE
jgi:hypothetical protein